MAPILHDEIWRRLAWNSETLCAQCVSDRARDRCIDLRLADLRPSAFNLCPTESGLSWFDLFLGAESEKSEVPDLAGWQQSCSFLQATCPIEVLRRTLEEEGQSLVGKQSSSARSQTSLPRTRKRTRGLVRKTLPK
jgi:hypothetical protein